MVFLVVWQVSIFTIQLFTYTKKRKEKKEKVKGELKGSGTYNG